MAFSDNPQVDEKSKISQESVLFVKSIFSKKNGFIYRDEPEDYGVDLNIELVDSHSHASSKIFPVQIKSESSLNIIEVEYQQYVSINFKTSRLGYLARREPIYGIIAVYDDALEICYFDYVDEIINRIRFERGNEDWKSQETVNIHIAINKLDSNSFKSIHEKFTKRFENLSLLILTHGTEFSIPVLYENIEASTFNVNDSKSVLAFLKENGLILFSKNEYSFIAGLLASLPISMIITSFEVTYLAAITYGHIGNVLDADYYIKRFKQFKTKTTGDESNIIELTGYRIEFLKGNINTKELLTLYSNLKQKFSDELNILNIDIYILYFKIHDSFNNRDQTENEFVNLIDELFERIQIAKIDLKNKNLLLLFNSENLFGYGVNLLVKDGGKLRIQMSLGINVSLEERAYRAKKCIRAISGAQEIARRIYKETNELTEKRVKAQAGYCLAFYFFVLQFNYYFTIDYKNAESGEEALNSFKSSIAHSYQSYNFFMELSMVKEGHMSLSCAYELQSLYFDIYKLDIGTKLISEIGDMLKDLELQSGIAGFDSTVEKAINDRKKVRDDDLTRSKYSQIPEAEIMKYAQMALDSYEIPIERLKNIIHEIEAHRIFDRECLNPDLELVVDLTHLRTKRTAYSELPMFMIQSKKTGIISSRSSNVNKLLEQFSTLIKRKI